MGEVEQKRERVAEDERESGRERGRKSVGVKERECER